MKSQVLLYTSCEGGRVGCGCGGDVGKLSSRTETRQLIPQLLSTCHMSIWSDWLPNRSALLDGVHSVNCVCAKQKTEGKNPANKRLSNEETKGAYARLDRGRLRRVLSTRPRESGAWLTGSNSHSKPLTVSLVSITLKKATRTIYSAVCEFTRSFGQFGISQDRRLFVNSERVLGWKGGGWRSTTRCRG